MRRAVWSIAAIVLVVVGLFVVGMLQALNLCACSSSPAPAPASPVVGVVVAVDSSGLGRVGGFSIRVADGSTIDFELGALENPTEFPPSHLAEHMASSQPVRVFFRQEPGQRLDVYRLEDATASPSTTP
jgi:hypothetical protein